MAAKQKTTKRTSGSTKFKQDAHALQRAVSELVRLYQFRDRSSICYYDISVTQCHALSAIDGQGPLKLGRLAEELYLDKSTTSRVVVSLEQKGYVKRSVDADDARAINLTATARGRKLYARIVRDLEIEMEEIVVGFDSEARQAAIRIVTLLTEAAASRFAKAGIDCAD